MKKIINTKNAPAPIGPYNQAIKVDNMLYTSGQIAINIETGGLNTSNITDETTLVMKHIGAILKEADMDYSNVIKSTIFIKNMDEFAEINEAYGSFFKENPPARETVEVARLPKDVNVEISVIAAE